MIEVKNVSHRLGGKTVLEKVNLTVEEGSIVGLVGINGAGKSTLLRLISGVYQPDEGQIFSDGRLTSKEEGRRNLFFFRMILIILCAPPERAFWSCTKPFIRNWIKRPTDGCLAHGSFPTINPSAPSPKVCAVGCLLPLRLQLDRNIFFSTKPLTDWIPLPG